MSRGLSVDLINALQSDVFRPIVLVEMQFASGTIRTSSSYRTLSWGGYDWLGTGLVLSLTEVNDTQEMQANSVSLQLTGVPLDTLAIALDDAEYKGRACKIYVGGLGKDNPLYTIGGEPITDIAGNQLYLIGTTDQYNIIDAFPVFSGLMDNAVIEDSGTTATISLSVESRLAGFLRTRESRYTDQDQKRRYPADRGFEYVAGLQGKDTEWGRTA